MVKLETALSRMEGEVVICNFNMPIKHQLNGELLIPESIMISIDEYNFSIRKAEFEVDALTGYNLLQHDVRHIET